jgi:hypothetical protein
MLAIAFFGSKTTLADLGALSRLSVITAIFGSLLTNVLLPAFSRSKTRQDSILKYGLVVVTFLLGSSLLIGVTALYPVQIVSVLGGRYQSLYSVAVLMIISSLVPTFTGLIWAMNAARGWVKWAWLSIPAIVLSQMIAAFKLDLSTIRGVLLFGAVPELAGLFVLIPLAVLGLKNISIEGSV